MNLDTDAMNQFVEDRYKSAIDYYWKASRHNKRAYKWIRSLTLILGALVTLISSLTTAEQIHSDPFWSDFLSIGTPVIAAVLTILSSFSQSFQWGATWHDMVMTAQLLEKERDRFLVTKAEDRDLAKEVAILNDFVISESNDFFKRIIGSFKTEKKR